jgi:hypothetical protein
MTFLSPWLLLGMVVAAVPILLHLLRTGDRETVSFPALRYLSRTTRESARVIRLRQLLLLGLRIAAVLLIAFAGARLVLPVGGRDHPPADLVFVVDNGLTSGAVLGDGRALDSLVSRGLEALERTGSRDQIWIVAAGEPWRPAVPLTRLEAGEALSRLRPMQVTADLPAALSRAASLLEASDLALSEIVLFSDLHPAAFPLSEAGAVPRPQNVRIAPPPVGALQNRGVARITISGGLVPRVQEPGELEVVVEGTEAAGTPVRAYVGDLLVGSATTGEDGTARLPLPPSPAGWVTGRVELDADALRGDDVRYFTHRVIPPPTVHADGIHSSYLEDALAVLDGAGRIRLSPPNDASVHFLTAGALSGVPEDGVAIVVPPNDPALLPSVNRILEELAPGWRLEATQNVAPAPGGTGAAERTVTGGSLAGLLPVPPRVRLGYRILGDGPGVAFPLLTLADGDAWLVRIPSSGRTVLVLGSPLLPQATDLPASASMLPLLDVLITTPTGEPVPTEIRTGTALPIPSDAQAIRLPDGRREALEPGAPFRRTGFAGVYELLGSGDEPVAYVAVNPATPGAWASLTPTEASTLLQDSWETALPADPWPDAVLAGREGREVWWPLAWLLLLVLLAESWLARAGAGRTPTLPGGRSPVERELARGPAHTRQ